MPILKDNEDEITEENIEENKIEKQKRMLKEICSRVIIPLCSLLSRTYTELNFKDMIYDSNTKNIINDILKDKKIILNKNSYDSIIKIMNSNDEIINNIREIYQNAPANKIHQLIAKHFIPSIEEKKNNAEIPTPLHLVEEMLEKIPEEFWKEKNKVFVPCCGKGNFVMKIFEKFYNGLAEKYQESSKRCKIIITKCLYFSDITPMNIFITTEILKCEIQSRTGNEKEIKYSFNSNVGNTLQLDIKKKYNIDKFDAIIGNPPYNDDSGNKGKGHMLWDKFVEKSLNEMLKENGYLLYVHPAVWRQIEHPCLNLIKNKQLLYLEIHNVNDGLKTFKCSTRYDWYLLQNIKNTNFTIIKEEDGKINKINLKKWNFIPNMMFDEIENLLATDNNTLDVNYYRSDYGADKKWVSKNKNNEFKYPVVYSINKNNELSLRYSNTNDKGHFGKSKFIFSNGAGFYCDKKGEYGLTQWAYCIYDDEKKLESIEKVFRSSKFNKIKESIQLDSSSYNIKVMKLFKKDFYKAFEDNEQLSKNNIIKRSISSKIVKENNNLSDSENETKPKIKINKSKINKSKDNKSKVIKT
jgi:hypothetical protein